MPRDDQPEGGALGYLVDDTSQADTQPTAPVDPLVAPASGTYELPAPPPVEASPPVPAPALSYDLPPPPPAAASSASAPPPLLIDDLTLSGAPPPTLPSSALTLAIQVADVSPVGSAPSPPPLAGPLSTVAPDARQRASDLDPPPPDFAQPQRLTPTMGVGSALPSSAKLTREISQPVFRWLRSLVKSLRGLRFYADNNATLQEYLHESVTGLDLLLQQLPELAIVIREDRIEYGPDIVHSDADRGEGLPFVLFRNSIRKLTFKRGFTADDLIRLLRTINTDFASSDLAGEDLVSGLWRLDLPNFEYVAADGLAVGSWTKPTGGTDGGGGDAVDIARVQAEIDAIVEALSARVPQPEDIIAGISVTQDDLRALEAVRSAADEGPDLLDYARAKVAASFDGGGFELMMQEHLTLDSRGELVHKATDLMFAALVSDRAPTIASGAVALLTQLFDAIVGKHQFADATGLILRLRAVEATGGPGAGICQTLLQTLIDSSRLIHVVRALNEPDPRTPLSDVFEFVRVVGQYGPEAPIELLEFVDQPAHRRVLCDIVAEGTLPNPDALLARMVRSKWFVAIDILHLAKNYGAEAFAPFLLRALEHERPRVRMQAVGDLRGYPQESADRLLAIRLADADFDVRMAAIRVITARKSSYARAAIEVILQAENLTERDPKELRSLMAAYATLAGHEAVGALTQVLHQSMFTRRKTAEAQSAAAFALGMIGTESAREALKKGTRSLNKKVRESCRRALEREIEPGITLAPSSMGSPSVPPPERPTLPTDPEDP